MYQDDDFKDDDQEESSVSQNPILDFYNANKKMIWILGGVIVFILIASLFLRGGNGGTDKPEEYKMAISKETAVVSINNSLQLVASIIDNPTVFPIWTSSDSSVATVDPSSGIVKGVKYGTATITATYTDANNNVYTAHCIVTVADGNPNIQVTDVKFPEGEVMISVGDEYELPVIVTPSDGYITNATYTPYNQNVVSVGVDGTIKALKAGKGIIKLSVNGQFTDEINVNVVNNKILPQVVINPISITFEEKLLKVAVGSTVSLKYDYEPSNAAAANLSWESSNESVATVLNGSVTGLKIGTSEITVKALNGVNAIMTVEVVAKKIPVESVQILSDATINLSTGGVSSIMANVVPGDATNKTITFSSSNTSVATVDNDGNVKAVSAGTATITATSQDGNKTASVTVNVTGTTGSIGGSGGSGGSSGSSGGSSSTTVGSIKYTDGKDSSLTTNFTTALDDKNNTGPIKVSIKSGTVTKIKYCVEKCTSESQCKKPTCTASTEITEFPEEISVSGNGLYVIKSTKYNGSKSSDVSLYYINVGGVRKLDGSTSTDEEEACYLVGGTYKWLTESEAKKQDDIDEVPDAKTEAQCKAKNNPVTKTFSINKETNGLSEDKLGYAYRLRFISNSALKKIYYCYGASCTINTSSASSASSGSGKFGGTIGLSTNTTYYKSASAGKTYYFSVSSTSSNFTKYFYVQGSSSTTVRFKAEYADGTYSGLARVSLTRPSS